MLGRLCLFAVIVASVYGNDMSHLVALRRGGASSVAVLGTDGILRVNENYALQRKDINAILDALDKPSDAVANGLDVYNQHINVENADEKFVEGSFAGSKFYVFRTTKVIVASVWPETNTDSKSEVLNLIDFLTNEYE